MLTNSGGLPTLETGDYASAAALATLATAADNMFAAQEQDIDHLERPEAAILKMSGDQGAGSFNTTVDYDTVLFQSVPGVDAFFGLSFFGGTWRPGIYHAGAYCQVLTSGTINSVYIDLILQDRRGSSKIVNLYNESERELQSSTARGANDLSIERTFEMRDMSTAALSVNVAAVGGGTLTVKSSASRLWIYRVRGL